MFSSYLERCMDIFSRKYSPFSQQIAISWWQNGHAHIAINKAFLAFYGAGRWDLFSSFFI